MTDLKALLDAEANATPPPAIDIDATIIRIARHRRRRTAVVAGAAAVVVAATATFSFGNPSGEIPTVAPSTIPTPSPVGGCGKPVSVPNSPAIPLRMTLKSTGIRDSSPPHITIEVKVTNHSARTLSGWTARGPLTVAAINGNAFAFGGQFSSAERFELAPGASATYTGGVLLGECSNWKDFNGRNFEVYAQQIFTIDGKSYTVSGGPWVS